MFLIPKRYHTLFIFKRRPRIFGIPIDWEKPDEATYRQILGWEGFVSMEDWQDDDIASKHPVVAQDLRDLEQHLLPAFFEFRQKSDHYQNKFYLYQWIFVFGAFLTTIFGTLAAFVYNADPNNILQQTLSYATAAIGAFTGFVTTLSNRGEPQKRWLKTRRLAEELRMQYFKYLAHEAPYDTPERIQKLRENVVSTRLKEQQNA